MHYDFLVVGAGLFGSTFAYEMKKRNKTCLVIDKRNHIGGNIYTERNQDIHVHQYGAHIFHTSNKLIWNYMNNFSEFNHYINSPLTIYKGEIYNLPFNMNTFSKMWGVLTPEEAKQKVEAQIKDLNIQNPRNLEEQALSLVGMDIYEKLVKGYTEKQWGRDCKDLPAFIIKRLPVRFTYDNNYFNDPYQGIPIGGYTKIVEQMLEGIGVKLNTDFNTYVDMKIRQTKEGHTFDSLLYTGPIDEFYEYKHGYLEYRSLRFETEYYEDIDNKQGNAVINYAEKEIPYTRVIEHKHFEFGKGKGTIITKEYPAEWGPDIEPYYPINNEKNQKLYQVYKSLSAKENKIYFGGRLGQYQYFDMDKTIESVFSLIEKLL